MRVTVPFEIDGSINETIGVPGVSDFLHADTTAAIARIADSNFFMSLEIDVKQYVNGYFAFASYSARTASIYSMSSSVRS